MAVSQGLQMASAKQEHERRVFDAFVDLSEMPVVTGTIRPGEAGLKEPDIICQIARFGAAGFELTRIAEEDFMEARGQVAHIDRKLRDDFDRLPSARQKRLASKYSDADIGVSFAFGLGFRAVRDAVPRVLDELDKLQPAFAGQHRLDYTGRKDPIQWISVHRIRGLERPILHVVPPASWVSDVTCESIGVKLSKEYSDQPSHRELIAYYAEQPPALDGVRLPAIDEYIGRLSKLGPFTRLWIVNLWSGRIERMKIAGTIPQSESWTAPTDFAEW